MYDFIQAVEYVAKPQDIGTSQWTLVRGEDDVVEVVFCDVNFQYDNLSYFCHFGFFYGIVAKA